jgi:hypothetical protein
MKVIGIEQKFPAADVVKTLRRIADDAEKGDFGPIASGVVCLEVPDDIEVFLLGNRDPDRSVKDTVYSLSRALQRVTSHKKSEIDNAG